MIKAGIGQDSHKFATENKKLVLGGITIENEQGLQANSDGDVVLHALFNALSSALGGRSIGYYFPNTTPSNKNRNSKEFFTKLKELLQGYKINNISISIEALKPKLEPYILAMKKSIAEILNLKPNQIGITATSGEGLTCFGQGLGIQAIAVVSLVKC